MLKGGETGPAITPGTPEESELVLAIRYDPSGYQMPPTGKLDADQIESLTNWIKMGAPWPGNPPLAAKINEAEGINLAERAKHWSFQPITRPDVPKIENANWPRNPVDQFLLARLEAAKLQPASQASRRTWLRRITYDVTGLPPTTDEVEQFLNDLSPQAYEKVADRLLASPSYGERWARHWLDLVRYAETSGHEFDYEIEHSTEYRDYIVRALNADVPYDQLVMENIAGDLLPEPRRHPITGINESVIGTGIYWFGQGKHSPVDLLAEECDTIDNQLDVLGKTFLGLTIACARCHDHKFDPITTEDYYAMTGFLQSSRRQHAYIDPPKPMLSTIAKLEATQEAKSQLVAKRLERELKAGDVFTDRILQGADEAAKKDPSHPLHAWAVLSSLNDAEQFQRAKTQLLRNLSDLQAAADSNEAFADFTKESLDEWSRTGPAFQCGMETAGYLTTNTDHVELALPMAAHSGLLTGRLQGELRSPTFPITKRYVHYRMRRVGGRPSSGRATKDGQVHMIVDGFHFIKDPLYGQLTINVEKDAGFRWYRQDLEKFIGKKVYIEIQDEDDGYLVLDRILFSDTAPPPEPPNALVLEMLSQANVKSSEALRAGYARLLQDAVQLWQTHSEEREAQVRDLTSILNVMLQAVSLPKQITKGEVPRSIPSRSSILDWKRRFQSPGGRLP